MKTTDIELAVYKMPNEPIVFKPFDFNSWADVLEYIKGELADVDLEHCEEDILDAVKTGKYSNVIDVSEDAQLCGLDDIVLKYIGDYFDYIISAEDADGDIEPFFHYLDCLYRGKSPAETYKKFTDSYKGRWDYERSFWEEHFRDCYQTPPEVLRFIDYDEVKKFFSDLYIFIDSSRGLHGFMFEI